LFHRAGCGQAFGLIKSMGSFGHAKDQSTVAILQPFAGAVEN
jgi:hypothetical protein